MERERGTVRNPDGPLTPETYRKRRRGVFIALLLTIGLAAWLLSSGGGETTKTAQRPSPGKQPAAAGTPSGGSGHDSRRPKPASTLTVSATPTTTVTVTAAPTYPDTPCRKLPVRLVVRTTKNAYGEGEKPRLTVRASPSKRCALDPDNLQLLVKSGTQRVWSSQDCAGRDRWPQRIAPQHPYRTTVTWERHHSNPGSCGEQPQPAGPGWYTVVAVLGEHEGGGTTFRLVSR